MTDADRQARAVIGIQAADWYARLRAPAVSEIDAQRFRAWLAGDPRRRHEFEAVDAFWNGLDRIEQSPEVRRVREEVAARGSRERLRWRAPAALAAAVATLAIAGGLFWQHLYANRFVTGVGELRTVPLADGSVVTLNTSTEIRLRYSGDRRTIELLRGQANFEVAKDPARPFVVTAGGGAVRALGTVFDVYKTSDRVTVTLIEGKVAVNPASAGRGQQADAAEIRLAAGEQLSFSTVPAHAIEHVVADVSRTTAWRARKLDFSDTPLEQAIAEANRYSQEQIVLHAPALREARISGTFEAGKNELFVEGLQTYFRLNAGRDADHRIVLTEEMPPLH